MVKHTEIICQFLPTNFLNVFDHFVGLVLKGLKMVNWNDEFVFGLFEYLKAWFFRCFSMLNAQVLTIILDDVNAIKITLKNTAKKMELR